MFSEMYSEDFKRKILKFEKMCMDQIDYEEIDQCAYELAITACFEILGPKRANSIMSQIKWIF